LTLVRRRESVLHKCLVLRLPPPRRRAAADSSSRAKRKR
jgi:hypothetical protein